VPDRADPEAASEQPGGRGRGGYGRPLFTVAVLGGAVALAFNEDLRNKLLDMLFGAEEEFDYSSVTEPPAPAAPAAATEPWVRPAEHAPAPAPGLAPHPEAQAAPASDSPPIDPDAPTVARADPAPQRGGASVAPSPAAWRAAAAEDAKAANGEQASPRAASAPAKSIPPEPPRGWWTPSSGADSLES
jgi:hypothetical protein